MTVSTITGVSLGNLVTYETNSVTGGIEVSQFPFLGKVRGSRAPMPMFGDDMALTDITVVTGGPTLEITTGPNGHRALKVTTAVGAHCELSFPAFVGSLHSGEVYLAMHGGQRDGLSQVAFYATPDAGYGTNFVVGTYINLPDPVAVSSPAEQGGAWTCRLGKSTASVTGTINYPFAINAHKLRITPRAGMSATVYIYGIGFAAPPTKGRICVVADDGYNSWFGLGQPLFDARGIPVTVAAIPSVMGSAPEYARMRQLKSLVNRGGAVVAHGPNTGGGAGNLLTAYPGNTGAQVADMVAVRDALRDNGLLIEGAEKCYVWPQGQFQSAHGDTTLLDAAFAAGFSCGRAASALSSGLYFSADAQSKYQHLAMPIIGHTWAGSSAAEDTNITNIVAAINNAAAQKSDVYLMLHRVQPTATADGSMNAIGIRVSDLTTIADAIQTAVNAGTLEAVVMPALAADPAGSWFGMQ